MQNPSIPRFGPRSPSALGAAIGLGACAIVCFAPVVLAVSGVRAATAIVCDESEALAFVLAGGTAAAMAVAFFRRRAPLREDCGCSGAASSGVPLACDLSVFTPAERREHLERSRRLFSSVEQTREEADGFTFTFP